MPKTKKVSQSTNTKKIRPAISPEARENQLIGLAYDLVEKRLLEGTATSQETTSLIKLGNTKARLEIEKMRYETELVKAKTDAIESASNAEKLFEDAMKAMQEYSGSTQEEAE